MVLDKVEIHPHKGLVWILGEKVGYGFAILRMHNIIGVEKINIIHLVLGIHGTNVAICPCTLFGGRYNLFDGKGIGALKFVRIRGIANDQHNKLRVEGLGFNILQTRFHVLKMFFGTRYTNTK
jgi:hypothetical protein